MQRLRSLALGSGRRSLSLSAPIPTVPLWIGGEALASSSGGTSLTRHAKTGKETCEVVIAGKEEIEKAVKGSQRAFEEWRSVSGWERRKILRTVLRLLQERFPLFEEALRADIAVSDALIGADRRSAVNLVDGAASTAIEIEGHIPQTVDNLLALVFREPFGPVLSIPAFNYPLTLGLRSIVNPLACSNTVIFRSSVRIPQMHALFGPLFADAGLPPGCLQILNSSEQDVADHTEQLIAHPSVRMVNFTGSVRLGRILAATCGRYLKPSVMELGGKSPAIILPSADLKLAANNILFAAFFSSGQVCMSNERAIVHESVADEFESVLRVTARVLANREGFELARPGAAKHLRFLVDEALSGCARMIFPIAQSLKSDTSRTSHPAIILKDVPLSSDLTRDESFAPVLTVERASSISHAIQLANSHNTGLSASIFTSDHLEALDIARKLESGAVHINRMTIHDEHVLPHGGVKASGWGRFNGKGAVESFTYMKSVTLGGGMMLPLDAI